METRQKYFNLKKLFTKGINNNNNTNGNGQRKNFLVSNFCFCNLFNVILVC